MGEVRGVLLAVATACSLPSCSLLFSESAPAKDAGVAVQLTGLGFSGTSALQPPFDPLTFSYELDVSVIESEIFVTPQAESFATIELGGVAVDNGAAFGPIALNLDLNELVVEVRVGAESQSYSVAITRGGDEIEQLAYLKASSTEAGDRFGNSVALSGDTLVVGAHAQDDGGMDSGAVYVFRRSGSSWQEEAYIKAGTVGAGDSFGDAVAIFGDTLAVGAPNEDSNATGINGSETNDESEDSGAVFVFHREETSWNPQAYLKPSNTEAEDAFGASVSLFGDTLAVGAPYEDSDATGVAGMQDDNSKSESGAVYVFRRDAAALWSQEAYIKASNTDSEDRFGLQVALWADRLAIGALLESSSASGVGGVQNDNSATNSGAVYIFHRDGDWEQEAYIKASNTDQGDRFGHRLALAGNTLAVGAYAEDSSAIGIGNGELDNDAQLSGAVYVFRHTEDGWSQEAYVKASNTNTDDRFGHSLALFGDTLAVGAHFEGSNAASNPGNNDASESGAVYVFRRDGLRWTQAQYLKASNTDTGDHYGLSVALSADTLVVGAPSEDSAPMEELDNSSPDAGAIYLYQ